MCFFFFFFFCSNYTEKFISSKVIFLTWQDLPCRSRWVMRSGCPARTFLQRVLVVPNNYTTCDNHDLRDQIMWQLLRLPGSLFCPQGVNEFDFFYKSETVRLGLGKRSDVKMEQVCFVFFFHAYCYTDFTIGCFYYKCSNTKRSKRSIDTCMRKNKK